MTSKVSDFVVVFVHSLVSRFVKFVPFVFTLIVVSFLPLAVVVRALIQMNWKTRSGLLCWVVRRARLHNNGAISLFYGRCHAFY